MTKISINQETCIGCGACTAVAPEIFELDNELMKAKVKKQPANDSELQQAREGADTCPVQAIKVKE